MSFKFFIHDSGHFQQLNFIAGTLITNWTVSLDQVEANPLLYDGDRMDFAELGGFVYQSTNELRSEILYLVTNANAYFANGSSSVAV